MRIVITFFLLLMSFFNLNAQCWKYISSGYAHGLAIKSDSSLWAWGYNFSGQVGNGTTTVQMMPTQIGTSKWSMVTGAQMHSLGIKDDGTLWSWGSNQYGQLGTGNNNSYYVPIQVGNSNNWKYIANGQMNSFAIKTDGTLWSWGLNWSGELGIGSNTISSINYPIQVGNSSNWKKVMGGLNHILAIKEDSTLWAWGNGYHGQLGVGNNSDYLYPVQIGNSSDWIEICGGTHFSCGIKSDGTLWTWGWNYVGQLGDGTLISKNIPSQVGNDTDWKKVVAGEDFVIALKSNGTVWSWGKNNYGQLGLGNNVNFNVPQQIGNAGNWQQISAYANAHSLAISAGGYLWSWGSNNAYQLGDGTDVDKKSPVNIACDPASVQELNKDYFPFRITPNPVGEYLVLNNNDLFVSLKIIDVFGQVVIEENNIFKNSQINVSSIKNGCYFVQISNSTGLTFIKRFIKAS